MNEYNRRSAWIALTLQGYLNIGLRPLLLLDRSDATKKHDYHHKIMGIEWAVMQTRPNSA
ncbi:hypothetical protein [Methylobacter tundripaludum]|uniref:hypothetical protein n=1 Tax=Methylobacter tundripaludum TaxID=173365 RepID=UPI00048309FB|nr:hypothetical protein [Methylobacter tundripaludum]